MGSLKVLHTCSSRQYVGEAARVIDAVDGLIQRGHQAEVICRLGYSVASQASRRRLPYTKINLLSRFTGLYDMLDVLSIRRRILAFKPDLIHTHQKKDHWITALALRTLKHRPPLLRTRHCVDVIRNHSANRWLYGKATDGLICVSNAARQATAKSESIIHCPVRTITGGITFAHLTPPKGDMVREFKKRYHIPTDANVVSCLARLVPSKGQDYLLKAIPGILKRHPNTVFLFSFPRKSTYAEHLYRIAETEKVRDSVRWIGDLDFLGSFLEATDIGVVPSIEAEGWSRAATEFLHFGIPVVASEVDSLPEIIRDSFNGYLVEPRDADSMGLKISALLDNPLLMVELGTAGRKVVRDEFLFTRTLDQLEAFYQEILEC